jgi:hypothetical protein
MDTRIIDISAKYMHYITNRLHFSHLFTGHQIKNLTNFCFEFDKYLSLHFEFENNVDLLGYKISLIYNTTIIVLVEVKCMNINILINYEINTIFHKKKLTNFPCQNFIKYEKLLNDFCLSYETYIQDEILHGNILLDIGQNDSIDFIAENNYTILTGDIWIFYFSRIKSAVIRINISAYTFESFCKKLMQFKMTH